MTFSDIVDATDALSVDEQEALLEILRRRISEQNREQLMRDVRDARSEFVKGKAQVAPVPEIMNEVGGEA